MISLPILTLTQQNYHHDHILTYLLLTTHFTSSVESLGHPVSKPQEQRKGYHVNSKGIHPPCECHITTT